MQPGEIDGKTLTQFVMHSNAIENEHHDYIEQRFQAHIGIAADIAASPDSGWLFTKDGLLVAHRALMQHDPWKFPGELRQMDVFVGQDKKMSPWQVREELPDLLSFARRGLPHDHADREAWAWHVHNWFEHIHPFCDGNGRLGRLFLNAARLYVGLPWLVVWEWERWQYYDRIIGWERDLSAWFRQMPDGLNIDDFVQASLTSWSTAA